VYGGNFGLWPQSAKAPGALLCTPMNCSLHFWNYTRRFIVNLNSDEVLGNHRRQSQESRLELGLRLSR
jgi:hypothetical protein